MVRILMGLCVLGAISACSSGGDSTCNPISSSVEHGIEIITCQNGSTVVTGVPIDSNNPVTTQPPA